MIFVQIWIRRFLPGGPSGAWTSAWSRRSPAAAACSACSRAPAVNIIKIITKHIYIYIYIHTHVVICYYILHVIIYIYIYMYIHKVSPISLLTLHPTNIARLKLSGKSPAGLGIPPLSIKIVLESNPLKSTFLVGRLGVTLSRRLLDMLNQ